MQLLRSDARTVEEKQRKDKVRSKSIHSLCCSNQSCTRMEAKLLHLLPSTPSSPIHLAPTKAAGTRHNNIIFSVFSPTRPQRLKISPIFNSTSTDGGSTSTPETDGNTVAPQPETTTGLRIKKRSRRRTKQPKEDGTDGFMKAQASRSVASTAPKKWDDMTLLEKALELYVGEKGLLFWINKFAYASIYIVIGAWILFRFVGPALNLYQLDAPPLSPTSILKGS